MLKKKRLLINAEHPEECRAVIVQEGKVDEYFVEHSARELLKGNVYMGEISRVEPAIEAAFVDFGGKKFGFLPFKDVLPESYLQTGERKAKTRIQDVLVKGQKLLVQVVKESRDAKGPSLTNAVTIPGRFLVLMCSKDSSGISRKIEDESERKKLKTLLKDIGVPDDMGVIIRTAGLGRTKLELQKDLQMIMKIWEGIEGKLNDSDLKTPAALYEIPGMVVRIARDHFTNDTEEIVVDNPAAYREIKDFMRLIMPRMSSRVKLYQEAQPLFSHHKVEEQIEDIYNRRVELPSGGSIIVDVGEAMVSIDVNSGKTTNASELEDTATRTNLEAAEEVARQLRLRDLGGLVVIDFIDMFMKKNKGAVEKQLKKACKVDRARINISRISRFGLMEMSRQRLSPPVKEGIFGECSHCKGSGHVRTDSSLSLSVLRKVQEFVARGHAKVLSVVASAEVVSYLLNNKTKFLTDFQEKYLCTIQFHSKPYLEFADFTYTILERKPEEDKASETRGTARTERVAGDSASTRDGDRPKDERPARRGRGRRPSAARSSTRTEGSAGGKPERSSRDRRPAAAKPSAQAEGNAEEKSERLDQEGRPSGNEAPKDGEGTTEEKSERRGRGRRSSNYRGKGGRNTSSNRTGNTRRRPARGPRTPTGAESSPAQSSEEGNSKVLSTEPSALPNSPSMDAPAGEPMRSGSSPDPKPVLKESVSHEDSDRQPMDNVSRLHEVVLDEAPKRFSSKEDSPQANEEPPPGV